MADEPATPATLSELQDAIKAALGTANPAAVAAVIKQTTDEEVSKNSKRLADGLGRMRAATAEVNKLSRHDNQVLGDDGKPVSSGYSPDRWKKLKAARELQARIATALEAAISNAEYQKLDKILSGKPGEPVKDDAATDE